MISVLTEIAIDYLASISFKQECDLLHTLTSVQLQDMLSRLEKGGLIRLCPGAEPGEPCSYELAADPFQVSLLDILTCLDEHLNCNHVASEHMYMRFGDTARKLGVLNAVMRTSLSNIKLTNL